MDVVRCYVEGQCCWAWEVLLLSIPKGFSLMMYDTMGHVTKISSDFLCFFQAEDGIRDIGVTGVQTCALPISTCCSPRRRPATSRARWCSGAMVLGRDGARDGRQADALIAARRRRNSARIRLCPCKIGRASCRERAQISVVAVSLKKKKIPGRR